MDPAGYNLTSPNTTLEDSRQSHMDIFKKLTIPLYSIIFILGIIGNGLVIWIAGFRMKKTINAVWFLHLAIADFLCCLSLPFRIAERFFKYSSSVAVVNIFCLFRIFLFYTSISASVLLLTSISIDRWLLVMWPLCAKTYRTCKRVRIMTGLIWVLSFLLSGLMIYLNSWCLMSRNESVSMNMKKIKQATQPVRMAIIFVIPFLIIVTSYVTIFLKIRKTKRSKRYHRSYRIFTAVIFCFFICWFPYYIWPLIHMYGEKDLQFYILNTIINSLACLNSCINPIIYVFMGQDFRRSFLRSLPCRLESAFGKITTDSVRETSQRTRDQLDILN